MTERENYTDSGDAKPFRCPYSDTKVWCNRRENEDKDRMACDSCPIILRT